MRILTLYRSFMRSLGLLELGTGIVLLAAIVALVFAQVVARYAFNEPQAWIEELCTYAFIWIVFLGASAAMKLDRHIRVVSLEEKAGPRAKIFLRLLSAAVTFAALGAVGFYASRFVSIEMRSTSIALPIDVPRAFFFSVPLIWACISISLSTLYVLACDIAQIRFGASMPAPFSSGAPKE